jgi:hypothetical protein
MKNYGYAPHELPTDRMGGPGKREKGLGDQTLLGVCTTSSPNANDLVWAVHTIRLSIRSPAKKKSDSRVEMTGTLPFSPYDRANPLPS